jgi:trehalose utilization protein
MELFSDGLIFGMTPGHETYPFFNVQSPRYTVMYRHIFWEAKILC